MIARLAATAVEGGRVELDGCPVAGDRDDVVDRERADADGDGCRDGRGLGRARWCSCLRFHTGPARAGMPRVGWRPGSQTGQVGMERPASKVPAADQTLAILAHLAAQRGPVPAATIAQALGMPALDGLPPARRHAGARLRRAPARGAPLRPRHRRVRAVERLQPAAAARAPRSPAGRGARRPARRVGPPRRAARTRRALPRRGARAAASVARDRRRRAAARAPHRDRPGDARRAAAGAAACALPRPGGVRAGVHGRRRRRASGATGA